MNDEQFSELFKRAVPPTQTPAGVVGGARRHLRIRRWAGGGMAVVLVTALTALALQLRGADDVVLTTPSPQSTATATTSLTSAAPTPSGVVPSGEPLRPEACNVPAGQESFGTLLASETLPTGVERAWLCSFGPELGPREPLTTGPDRVVAAINAAPTPTQPIEACTLIGGGSYFVVLDYPSGPRAVSIETVNCQWVGGWDSRLGGAEVMATLRGMWVAQRATLEPSSGQPQLCDAFPRSASDYGMAYNSIMWGDRAQAERGAVCGLSASASDHNGEVLQSWLPHDLVAALARATATEPAVVGVDPGLPYVVLLNRFDDPMTLPMTATGQFMWDGRLWSPPADVAARLREVLRPMRTTPFWERPRECRDYPARPHAKLADVVAGVVCVDDSRIPEKGPQLDPAFAVELAERFDAEAVAESWGTRNETGPVLRDANGRLLRLYYDAREPAGLVEESGKRVWRLPADIKAELERYGMDFTPL